MTDYFDRNKTDGEIAEAIPCAMRSTARFDAILTRRSLQERGFRPWQIVRHLYRPFDVRWLYWEPTTKLLDEKREEYVRLRAPNDFALVLPRQNRVTVNGPLVSFGFVDLNMADGGATAFPANLVSEDRLTGTEIYWNASNGLAALINERQSSMSDFSLHTIATLHAPAYLNGDRGDCSETGRVSPCLPRAISWPTQPFLVVVSPISLMPSLRSASPLNGHSWLPLSFRGLRGWKKPSSSPPTGQRGQNSTVMPGPGLFTARPWTNAEREKIAALAYPVSGF